jgi:hypothetical protein
VYRSSPIGNFIATNDLLRKSTLVKLIHRRAFDSGHSPIELVESDGAEFWNQGTAIHP